MAAERPRVDSGGTFTDGALVRGGQLFPSKLLTPYAAPEAAIIDGITRVARLAEIGAVVYGTSSGFRDVIEMRTGARCGERRRRGGPGQVVEIAPSARHEFHFNAMFDCVANVAHGRDGGQDGQAAPSSSTMAGQIASDREHAYVTADIGTSDP